MKKIGLFIMVILMAACSSNSDDAIKQKIIQKKIISLSDPDFHLILMGLTGFQGCFSLSFNIL